jgi:hypothetical protein
MLIVIMLNVILLSVVMLNVIILTVFMLKGIILIVIMLSVIILNDVMLSVVMLNVVLPSVVAPLLPLFVVKIDLTINGCSFVTGTAKAKDPFTLAISLSICLCDFKIFENR